MRPTYLAPVSLCSLLFLAPAEPRAQDETPPPRLLTWSEQITVREEWLAKRHQMLLPMMRRHGIDMWIVVNEEFHDDPLTEYVALPRPFAGNRDIFVFIDTGDEGLRKIAITGYDEDNLRRFFEPIRFSENPDKPIPPERVLVELFEEYNPETIALGIGGRRGMTRSLTHESYRFLSEAMGEEATRRFVSAADLIEEYLDTRIPDEFEHYLTNVHLTEVLARRAFSNEVITPGQNDHWRRSPVAVRRTLGGWSAHLVSTRPAPSTSGHASSDLARVPEGGERGSCHPARRRFARGLRRELHGSGQRLAKDGVRFTRR